MNKIIRIFVTNSASKTPNMFNLDVPPMAIPYPMTTASERQFAYNKYERWFTNSTILGNLQVKTTLAAMLDQGTTNEKIILGSEYRHVLSHVDTIVNYLVKSLNDKGYDTIVIFNDVEN